MDIDNTIYKSYYGNVMVDILKNGYVRIEIFSDILQDEYSMFSLALIDREHAIKLAKAILENLGKE